MRKYGKVDANHKEVADAFRKLGCSFLSLAPLGKGAPDALIGYGGICCAIEIKDGAKPKSAQKLTPAQREFWSTWKGGVRLVTDLQAVAETAQLLRRWQATLWEPQPYSTQPNPEALREMVR